MDRSQNRNCDPCDVAVLLCGGWILVPLLIIKFAALTLLIASSFIDFLFRVQ